MIHHFETIAPSEPEDKGHLQWFPALTAGLIAGLILLIVPRGSPWSTLTFFAPVVLGRVIPETTGISLPGAILFHLALSLVYGLVIARSVVHVTQLRSLLTGGIVGLILYVINFSIASAWIPEVRGNEFSVAFTHLVFGMISAGAYRGLLRRKVAITPAPPGS
jgi:hypothetical protein